MVKLAQRFLLVTAVAGVMILAGQSLAGAAILPEAASSPAMAGNAASPGTGIPILGGLVDSVVGIVTGTAYGIGDAVKAVLASLTGGAL
ncbi:hypothetical protein [Amycolatopsis anabasis]|uniref:hypothetical protein n=1 Tax=Amycolatopsis anabasis TaxID=1840409 RepID=UPI00131D807A|nr:hypothetical protein [Amycolatopsis anabasis]